MTSPANPNQAPQPQLSQAATDFLGKIASAKFPSEVRGLNPDLFHMVRTGEISPDEMEHITDAAAARRVALTMPSGLEPEDVPESGPIPQDTTAVPAPESPTAAALRQIQPPRNSWIELSQPKGDREP